VTSPLGPKLPVVGPVERGLLSPSSAARLRALDSAVDPASESGTAAPSFADLFKRALTDASSLEGESKDLIGAYLRGEPVELHQIMAASEEASISLELLVEIRNKLADAYRSVMNLQ
jgi:flagellar hook-basal body complex protein FliE